jgi:hypothetical protein
VGKIGHNVNGPLRTFAQLAPLQRSFPKPILRGNMQHHLSALGFSIADTHSGQSGTLQGSFPNSRPVHAVHRYWKSGRSC